MDRLQQAQWKLEGKCPECGLGLLDHSPFDCNVAHRQFLEEMRRQANDDVFAMIFDYALSSNTSVQPVLDPDERSV